MTPKSGRPGAEFPGHVLAFRRFRQEQDKPAEASAQEPSLAGALWAALLANHVKDAEASRLAVREFLVEALQEARRLGVA